MLYDATCGHTFSLYLDGGQGTRRLDRYCNGGWPGAVSVMPAGQWSDWEITTAFRFVHFHLPDDTLRAAYARTIDRDARLLDIREVTQDHDPAMMHPLAQMARAALNGDVLQADVAAAELIASLPERTITLKGGLSPRQLSLVDEWIAVHLGEAIRLADLAAVADLSEFHFHRMFFATRGTSPHRWVQSRRIDAAKILLSGGEPIAAIAASCGFSGQSHLTRVFKAETGTTPAAYRACLQN